MVVELGFVAVTTLGMDERRAMRQAVAVVKVGVGGGGEDVGAAPFAPAPAPDAEGGEGGMGGCCTWRRWESSGRGIPRQS